MKPPLPKEIDLPIAAFDLRGKKVGHLEVLYPCDSGPYGIKWVVRCDCGNHSVRTAGDINHAEKIGRECSCKECVLKIQNEYRARRHRQLQTQYFRELHENRGELWTEHDEAALAVDIRGEMAEYLGYRPRHIDEEEPISGPVATDPDFDGTKSYADDE
jgi:hypothetical protein